MAKKKREQEEPTAESTEPQPEEQLPPADEPTEPVGDPPAEEEQPGEPEEEAEENNEGEEEEEQQAAAEPGPLTKLQDAVRALFDHDQLSELRLAHIVMDLRAMRVAGSLPEAVEVAFREMGYAHLIEDAKPAGDRSDDDVDQAVHDHVRELDEQEADAAALAAETGAVTEEPAGVSA